MPKMKITVLKRMFNQDLADQYYRSGGRVLCSSFVEGQEFTLEGTIPSCLTKPEGFCGWAWDDIHKTYLALLFGGSFDRFMTADNSIISCCTDGVRPVVFKIERIES